MRAGRAAATAGVTVKALRYYEELGLVQPTRLANGYRDYTDEDVRLVAEIRLLASLGLTPGETRPFLDCLREGHDTGDDCPESLAAYQSKIAKLDQAVARLTSAREQLVRQMYAAARRGFRGSHDHNKEIPSMMPQPDKLPDDLPVPEDDGAADHVTGLRLPALEFTGTDGASERLDEVSDGRWVLFIYPLTGEPGADIPKGWNEIPGARGCSQEACGFRDNLAALRDHGVERVLGLSSDRAEYQQDLVSRLRLPYPLLSDPELSLARSLKLPTFDADGGTLYKRLTMVVRGNQIEHVFYPIFPPDTHATEIVHWLTEIASPPHRHD